MEDEEYPAYLREQTMDDLVGISSSINQKTQPKRYAMVLAELVEREKRGERPTPRRRRNKKYGKVMYLAGGLCLSGLSVAAIYTGRASTRWGPVYRSEDPGLFWVRTGFEILGALFLFYNVFRSEKEEN